MELIKGKIIADKILENISQKIKDEKLNPGLAVILIGDDEASKTYVRLKEKAAEKIGISFSLLKYKNDVTEKEVLEKINQLNNDAKTCGIIIQLPLPNHLNKLKIISAISPKKDADGFHPDNLKLFFSGKASLNPVFPSAIVKILESIPKSQSSEAGKYAVIIANSESFGQVMRKSLENIGIRAENLSCGALGMNNQKIKQAGIIITACGIPGLVKGNMVKKGAIIIDGGIARVGDKVKGDIDLDSVREIAGFISPVPGGVGPVTVACLLENVYRVASAQ